MQKERRFPVIVGQLGYSQISQIPMPHNRLTFIYITGSHGNHFATVYGAAKPNGIILMVKQCLTQCSQKCAGGLKSNDVNATDKFPRSPPPIYIDAVPKVSSMLV